MVQVKKKIIVLLSVILLAAALIAGWVLWKMSKNSDKDIVSSTPSNTLNEFVAEDGDKLSYSPDSKTLTLSGERIDIDFTELKNNPAYADLFEYAESIVFTEGVTDTSADYRSFKNVKTVKICSTMYSLDWNNMPPLEKYIVSPECEHFYSDKSGVLYTVGYTTYASGTVKTVCLADVPYNSPLTEYTIPDDVNKWIYSGALDTANLKKVIFSQGTAANVYDALHMLNNVEFYEVHPQNKLYCSDEQGVIYSKDKTRIYGIPSTVEEFVIPENSQFDYLSPFNDITDLNTFIHYNTSVKKISLPSGFSDFEKLLYFANLEEIVIPENDPYLCMVDGVVFTKDMTEMVCYPNTKDGDYYEIPESVVSVRGNCFTTRKLKKLVISDGVEKVGAYAFHYATGLESVSIGKNVKEFAGHTITLTSDGESLNPFEYCVNLYEILVDTDNPYFCNDFNYALYTKDMKILMAFPAASRTNPVNIPESVETIRSAFRNCKNLKVINLGKNVTDIFFYTFDEYNNYHSFENCSSLQEINFSPDNPKYSSKNGIVYSKNGNAMILYPQGKTNKNLILSSCGIPSYGAIYKNKHLETIYVSWEKPKGFVKDGYFGHEQNPWIDDFSFPYEIYYTCSDGLSYEK